MPSPITPRAALLHVLTFGEGYGLSLMERAEQLSGGAVTLTQGTVYPTLRTLEDEGLVESRESEPLPERGGRPRIYYKLTRAGVDAAEQQRAAMVAFFQRSA